MLAENIETLAEDAGFGPMNEVIHAELSEKVFSAVQSLPTSQRMAILLQHFEGLSYRETADVMDTTCSAIDSLLVRAKKALRQKLKNVK